MTIKVKNAILSAFFGALGPFFNKQATLDQDRAVYRFFNDNQVSWAIYPFDIFCIVLMLVVNTIAVKYKMLSYKYDGAFLGTTLIFVLGYAFSACFDYLYEGEVPSLKQTGGALMMIFGIILISSQEEKEKIKKHTNSFYQLIAENKDNKELPLPEEEDRKTECLIDKTKTPSDQSSPTDKPHKNSKKSGTDPQSKDCSIFTNSSRSASRHKPGEMGAIDFIHMRKGVL